MLASHRLGDDRDRRLEGLIAVLVVSRAAIDRHRDECCKKRGIDNRPHERHQIEPFHSKRPRPPDQREGK